MNNTAPKLVSQVNYPDTNSPRPYLTSKQRDDGFIVTLCPSSKHSLKLASPALSLAFLSDHQPTIPKPLTTKKLFTRTQAVVDWLDKLQARCSIISFFNSFIQTRQFSKSTIRTKWPKINNEPLPQRECWDPICNYTFTGSYSYLTYTPKTPQRSKLTRLTF